MCGRKVKLVMSGRKTDQSAEDACQFIAICKLGSRVGLYRSVNKPLKRNSHCLCSQPLPSNTEEQPTFEM